MKLRWDTLKEKDLTYAVLYVLLGHLFFYGLLMPGQMVFGTDIQNQSYPLQVMGMREIFRNGSIPLWNPYIFSGMPFLASFSFHIFYPLSWIFFLFSTAFATGYLIVIHFCLMGIFTYALLRHLGISREASFVGGLVFMFNAHFVSLVYPGHGGKIYTMTYLPLALMYLDRGFKARPLFNFTMLGLMVGLMFYGGHPQILFYCGIALSLMFLFLAAAWYSVHRVPGTLRLGLFFTASFVVGGLLYAAILLPAMEYKGYTNRAGGLTGASSYELASSFSQPPEDMLYIPLRNPFGWGKDYGSKIPTTSDIFYRGRIGLRLSVDYAGVFALILALIGAVFVRNRYTWYFVALALLAAFLSLGQFNPLYYDIYKYVPGFSMFRVPYAIMILLPLCWGVLSAFGLQYLMDVDYAKKGSGLRYLTYAVGLLAMAVTATGLYWRSHSASVIDGLLGVEWVREMLWGFYADVEERFFFFSRNLLIFGVLLAVSALLLIAFRKGWVARKYIALAAALFILADLWPVGWEFIKTVPTERLEQDFYPETPAIKTLKADKDGRFRVFSMVTNNELLYYGIESMTGYHAVVLGYYEQALSRMDFGGPLLDLLNARYLMLPKTPEYDFSAYPDAEVRDAMAAKYELLDDRDMYFYKNREATGSAYLVNAIWIAGSQDEALAIVTDRRFKPREAAVVAEEPKFEMLPGADLSGQMVEQTQFAPDEIAFRVSSPAPSFMVVSDVWYPGWKAYLDGVETVVYRTDFLLRGVAMPAGEHELKMVFDPPRYKTGVAVTLVTLTLAGLVIGWEYRGRRRKI